MLSGQNRYLSIVVAVFLVMFGKPSLILSQDESPSEPIVYVVDLADVRNHYVSIEMKVPANAEQTQLMMAVWTPGSYLVREYARHIDSLEVYNSSHEKIPFEKTRKNRWTVETKGIKEFHVRYRLYCNELSVRTNWVGSEFAIINGGATFLTVPDKLERAHIVELKLPRVWTRSATSLKSEDATPHRYVADNFDELVDSPIVAGNINVYPFEGGGIQHQLVNVGESGYWDGTKAASDLKKIVEAHQQMWGTTPYDRYLFLNVISGRGGGLEHDNCTLIMTTPWTFREKKRYKDWLSLASHEFFHTWNVRRLRPRELMNYDYENETYTRSLWVAEGITSYYEDLLLVRVGLYSLDDYLERLNSNIGAVQNTMGREKQSLSESSYDTWIKFYRPDENSSNTRISYYSKGALVAFLLDTRIRELTGGKKSLDDVMRQLYQNYSATGYTPSDFRAVATEVAEQDLNAWFTLAVDSTAELDFEAVHDWFGLEFADVKSTTTAGTSEEPGEQSDDDAEMGNGEADEPDVALNHDGPETAERGKPWLGFAGSERVSSVEANSPATDAGLNPGDEILAVNGFRLNSGIESRLKQYEIGDELDLLISRRGKIETLRIKIGSKVPKTWRLKVAKDQTTEQKQNLQNWLGIEEPKTSNESDGS